MSQKQFSLATKTVTKDVLVKPNIVSNAPHFNGQRFFNPWEREERNQAALLKWILSRDNRTWPENLSNKPFAKPTAHFSDDLADWKMWFVGHATVLLQIGCYNLLTDPVWAERCSPFKYAGPKRVRPAGIALEDLPPIDAILLSHNHYDHLDTASLLWLQQHHQPLVITGLGNGAYLRDYGLEVIELDWWQSYSLAEDIDIHYLPAKHFSGRGMRDRNVALWGSLSVVTEFGHAYFAGDTGYAPHFSEIYQRLGAPRVALLPIGAYLPRELMRQVHMNPADAVQAHLDLKAQLSLGIHFNTFQLTDETIDAPLTDLKKSLWQQQVPEQDFIVLLEGEGREV